MTNAATLSRVPVFLYPDPTNGNILIGSISGAPATLGGSSTVVVRGIGTNPGGIQYTGSVNGGGLVSGITPTGGGIALGTYTGVIGSEVYAERMRITGDGNIAMGSTTTGTARLSVTGVSGANTIGELYMSDGTQWTRMGSNFQGFAYNGLITAGDHALIYSNGTPLTGAFVIAPWTSAAVPTSGIRLDANGNVSIRATSVTAGYALDVTGNIRSAGTVIATGEITAYFSDSRLKSNVVTITNAVDKVKSINGVYYNSNNLAADLLGEDITVQRTGLLAQEVEAVMPQIVRPAPFDIGDNGTSKSGENYKTLQYERLVPLLVEAIKELEARIAKLESKQS